MLHRIAATFRQLVSRMSPTQQLLKSRSIYLHGGTASGVAVNERSALGLAAFFACVRVIAETKASLPLHVFEITASGKKQRVTQHDVAGLLGTQPNHDQTPMVWNEYRAAQVLSSGNSYTEIVLDHRGRPLALIPHEWSTVEPFRDEAGELRYRVTAGSGEVRVLDCSQMLHVPGMGNGIVGWSPVRMHAETLGIALGADRFAASYFGNGVKPSIALSTAGRLDPESKKNLRADIDENYSGSNAHKAILLEGGLTVTPLSIPMDEAQFLESRIFEIQEIARIFRMPPHMIGDLSKATFSNIEAQDLSFEKHTIRPWLVRDEQELNRKLFPRSEWGRFYIKHNVDALLRADIKTRYEAYKIAILSGFKSRNEIRELEDLDPIAGGDELLLPEAIFGKSGGQPQATTQANAAPPPPDRRLVILARQLIAGLIQRERTHMQRASRDVKKLADFYVRHGNIVAQKLAPFGTPGTAVAAELLAHRDAVIIDGEDAGACCDRLTGRLDQLVEQLLGGDAVLVDSKFIDDDDCHSEDDTRTLED